MKLIWIVAILFVGCAGQKMKPEQIQEIKAISVLSLLPENVMLHNVGTTIFNNEEGSIPFKISQSMQGYSKKLLNPISVSSFNYDAQKYEAWRKERVSGVGGFLSMPNEMDFTKEYFLPLAEKAGVKFLVVFAPIRHDNYSLYPGGFGVFCRSAFGISGKAASYALYSGRLWDVAQKTFVYFEYFTPNTTNKETTFSCDDLAKMKSNEILKNFSKGIEETMQSTVIDFWKKSGLLAP